MKKLSSKYQICLTLTIWKNHAFELNIYGHSIIKKICFVKVSDRVQITLHLHINLYQWVFNIIPHILISLYIHSYHLRPSQSKTSCAHTTRSDIYDDLLLPKYSQQMYNNKGKWLWCFASHDCVLFKLYSSKHDKLCNHIHTYIHICYMCCFRCLEWEWFDSPISSGQWHAKASSVARPSLGLAQWQWLWWTIVKWDITDWGNDTSARREIHRRSKYRNRN